MENEQLDRIGGKFSEPGRARPIVRYIDVRKSFGDLEVIKGVSLDVMPGEKVAVIGPSGSGKTTLGRMLATLEEPTSGTIEVDGVELWREKKKERWVGAGDKHLHRMRSNIGMVFQHFHLFPHMTIIRNVAEAPRRVLRMPRKEAEERAVAMLDKVGLADKIDNYPSQLSGGQKQRVAIARALVMSPKVMVFDEVTSALDPELVGEVLEVIKQIARTSEMAMLLITHEMAFARDIADHVVFTADGYIVEQGPPERIFEHPESERLQSFLARFRSDF